MNLSAPGAAFIIQSLCAAKIPTVYQIDDTHESVSAFPHLSLPASHV
jgi:hypothetical protein